MNRPEPHAEDDASVPIQTLDKRLLLTLGLVVALIVVTAALDFWNTRQVYETTALVAHTNEALTSLERLHSTAKDAETGQRGFLITGDARYLEPFEEAARFLESEIQHVQRLTADDPRQQVRIPILRQRIAEKMSEIRRTIELRRKEGFEAAQEIVFTDEGKRTMDALREEIDTMEVEERRLLSERTSGSERSRAVAFVTNGVSALVGLALVLAFLQLFRRDIVARARGTRLLHEQKEIFRTTLASIGDAVITTDTDGRVWFLNGVAERLTGWTSKEATGVPLETVFHIVHEQTRRRIDDPALRALSAGVVVGLTNHTILVAKDGVERPIDDSAAPIRDAQGKLQGVVLVFRDITQRREIERALRDADQRKDEFLAVLAHELRNPLAPLRHALEIVHHSGDDPRAVAKVRGIMERQVQQMVRLIDDLLDVSRITRNALELRRETIDVAGIISGAMEASEPLLLEQGQKVTPNLPSERLYVDGDKTRLTQALCNLLGNSAKYSEPGGHVTVTARRRDGAVEVSVKDTGIGIPREMLDRVFEMFERVDRSPERSVDGLGIGLTLVRRIVELHGGTVEARSEGPGCGSEFVMRLPVVPPPPGDAKAPGRTDPKAVKRRILVADDNADSAESLAMMLRVMGNEVHSVNDGEQALQEGETFRPDVALLDIGMPKLDGYETARRIREASWGRDVMLIALTGWGQDDDKRRSQEAGFDHHLVKPVDVPTLVELLSGSAKVGGSR